MKQKVTFVLNPEIVGEAAEGLLLGDFNGWIHEQGTPLKKLKDGSMKATLSLEPGIYQYRYFLNDGRWVNDGNAHGYHFIGEYGVDNCVMVVEAPEAKPAADAVVNGENQPKPKRSAKPKAVAATEHAPAPKKATVAKTAEAGKPAKAVKPKAAAPAKKTAKAAPAKKTSARTSAKA